MADHWLDSIFKFLNWVIIATLTVVVFLSVAELITQSTNTERWIPGIILCFMGLGLYLGSVLLSRSYSINRTLATASLDSKVKARPEPQWIHFIGLLGISAMVASEILIFIYVFS
jgi:hypothetical protein